jgi:hypothetical protein
MSELTEQLRRLTNENVEDSEYSEDQLEAKLLNRLDDVYLAAADVWREKAAAAADLVDTTEGNSRRSWSKAYEQALAMATAMENQSSDNSKVFVPTARMRKITRT